MADSVPNLERAEHRSATRFDTALDVGVEGLGARTRNISASGVYFETQLNLPLGSLLNLDVQFTHGGQQHWLACEGKVVRVEEANGQNGIAARLLTPFFSSVDERVNAAVAKR